MDSVNEYTFSDSKPPQSTIAKVIVLNSYYGLYDRRSPGTYPSKSFQSIFGFF